MYANRHFLEHDAECPPCKGTGQTHTSVVAGMGSRPCYMCDGKGRITRRVPSDRVWTGHYREGPYFCCGLCAERWAQDAMRALSRAPGCEIGLSDEAWARLGTDDAHRAAEVAERLFADEGGYTVE